MLPIVDEIELLIGDLKSDKIQTRNKTFLKLSQLFTTNSSFKTLIEKPDNSNDIFDRLFISVENAIRLYARKLLSNNSELLSESHKKHMIITIDPLINTRDLFIDFSPLLQLVAEGLQSEEVQHTQFFKVYMDMLKSMLNKNSDEKFALVQKEVWAGLISNLLKFLKNSHQAEVVPPEDGIENLLKIIEYGTKFSQLSTVIFDLKVFQYIQKLFRKYDVDANKKEKLLVLSYRCCQCVAVDYRLEMCRFTESLIEDIHYVFQKNLKATRKSILFKLLDLMIIIHSPIIKHHNTPNIESIQDKERWKKFLKIYEWILDQEMVQTYDRIKFDKKYPEVNIDATTSFAVARYCYHYYWNDELRNTYDNDNDESASKRPKLTNKLQAVLEKVKPLNHTMENFNWNWFMVLAELIYNYSDALTNDDIFEVLNILSACQSQIRTTKQQYSFTVCCLVLLQRDETFKIYGNKIIYGQCEKMWSNISEEAARVCTSSSENSVEAHGVLQLLIYYKKLTSGSLIKRIINLFTTNSVIKCDYTLYTLITILQSINLDSMSNGNELALDMLKYIFEKSKIDVLKKISTMSNEKPTHQTISKLAVMCCLLKTDLVKYMRNLKLSESKLLNKIIDTTQLQEYKNEVTKTIQLIKFKSCYELLFEHNEPVANEKFNNEMISAMPIELKCIIDQKCYEELMKLTEFQTKCIGNDSSLIDIKNYLRDIMENNMLMLNLASEFLKFEAFNQEKYESSFITKKIDFNLQEINRLFSLLTQQNNRLDSRDKYNIMILVKSLFENSYHSVVGSKIRSQSLIECLKWILKQANFIHLSKDDDDNNMSQSKFSIDASKKIHNDEKISYLAIISLCEYFYFEGVDKTELENMILSTKLNVDSNMNVHAVLKVAEILGKQNTASHKLASWIFPHIIHIYQKHSDINYYIELLINQLENIVIISKSNIVLLSKNIILLFYVLTEACIIKKNNDVNRLFNEPMTSQFLRKFKFFHQTYFKFYTDDVRVQTMYANFIEHIVFSSSIEIRMTALDTLRTILHYDAENNLSATNEKFFKQNLDKVYGMLIEMVPQDYETANNDVENQNDIDLNTISFQIQFNSSGICSNFNMRLYHILTLSKIFHQFKIPDQISQNVVRKIQNHMNCIRFHSIIDDNDLVELVDMWMKYDNLATFPWYFAESESLENFIATFYREILLSFMKYGCEHVDEFVSGIELTPQQAFNYIIPQLLAFLIPYEAKCTIGYTDFARIAKTKLETVFTNGDLQVRLKDDISDVIVFILGNVVDSEKIQEIYGFNMNFSKNTETITIDDFKNCIDYIKKKFYMQTKDNLLTYLCMKNMKSIENIFVKLKKRIQSTELKERKVLYVTQYYIFIEETYDYMNNLNISKDANIKHYLIREIAVYFCILISNEKHGLKLRQIAANFFIMFLKNILPNCVNQVKLELNRITSQLISICQKLDSRTQELKTKCLQIMKFLILEQPKMNDEIAKLDRFPSDINFKDLRERHLQIKYSDGNKTLTQEIQHFLNGKIETRHPEGIAAIREHITTKRNELKHLFDEVIIEEDKEKTLLHKLIESLIFYASHNAPNNESRTMEAVKCLGELGAHTIASVVFNIENVQKHTIYDKIDNIEHCQKLICQKALDRIENLLLHPHPELFQVASEACYELLHSISSNEYTPSCYLRPFIPEKRSEMHIFYLEPKNHKKLKLFDIFSKPDVITYSDFIKNICLAIINFTGGKVMSNLITNQLIFAEYLLPTMFQLLLHYNTKSINEEINKTINYFFENVHEKLKYSEQTNKGSIFIDKKIIGQMLKLIEIIRIHCQDHPQSIIKSMQINLNFLKIAKAAKYCGAYFSAIQYCEIWAQDQLDRQKVEFVASLKNLELQEIMFQSYSAIGNKEARDLFLNPSTNRIVYLQSKGLYIQALLETNSQANYARRFEVLNESGMNQFASDYYKLTNKNLEINKAQHYNCLWELNQWDEIVEIDTEIRDDKGLIDYDAEFEKYHYLSLQCCKNDDELGMRNSIIKARNAVVTQINQQSFQCSQMLYKFLELTHRLAQLEDFAEVRFKRLHDSHNNLLDKWKFHDSVPFEYKYYERVLTQRNSIFDTANIKTGRRTWIPTALQNNLLFIAKQSIIFNHPNNAIKAISKMKILENVSVENQLKGLLEEAKLNMKGNTDLAMNCLKEILDNKYTDEDYILKCHTLRLYGEILAENYTMDIAEIYTKYFNQALVYLEKFAKYHKMDHLVSKLKTDSSSQDMIQMNIFTNLIEDNNIEEAEMKIRDASLIYDVMAKYYDREYEERMNYLKSSDFKRKKQSFEKNKERICAMKSKKNTSQDFKRSLIVLQKSTDLDKIEIEEAEKEKKNAARNSIYYYIRSTINSPEENIFNIFRIVCLTLNNFNSTFVQSIVKANLLTIPSYKFIPAIPQITVRLNNNKDDELNILLRNLLERCAIDHPHHTLPHILALRNSYKDSEKKSNDEPRVIGAKELWLHLKKNEKLAPIMEQMEAMSSALIDLANVELKQTAIPSNHPLLKLKNLIKIHCPTIDLPIVKNGDYSHSIISILKWSENIALVGGINAPKKINVICSDGTIRPQLLKGKDDMRQDAIFQQIFTVVNKLLNLDEEMQKKKARIRTYKVVPFSRRSGILEWCTNTLPIGNYLCGDRTSGKGIKKGAHYIYRPQDWSIEQCFSKISNVSQASNQEKLRVYNQVCENLKPVFHHFFDEHFRQPGKHFERRYAYTISVAVSSMIGYILGIGDRHVQNILIDLKTAELIHIDFGVAFEQGKCLPHPEYIPFRLTRDLVAPMGISGVDGIFRKVCEQTLDILCKNERTISTILEVLLYDPMYSWSLGAEAARRVQLEDDSNVDEEENQEEFDSMASRTLLRTQSKLKGIVEANNNTIYPSVEGYVQYLIQMATNPALLSRLFRGWQAYL
ncbi:hypothetical protein PVAND_013728 [Polypedilum vanderplanki]|uniref:Serine/threonine-protein kinase ATM n=1 Tax=Polypedilum vanderplanki TaxID=319348 RepID=A0A9J6CQ99_POLVA|nr:hypothetical protein PVAND_013728 [Polypedilum vanderplanki]